MTVEKECAEKKSEEMNARKRLASEEMRCAGLMAELDRLRRQLDDLKRQTRSICRPMTTAEKDQLRRNLTNIPDCYRQDIRDIIAETEGAHKVPVDGVENWNEIIEEFNEFGPVALEGWLGSSRCDVETPIIAAGERPGRRRPTRTSGTNGTCLHHRGDTTEGGGRVER